VNILKIDKHTLLRENLSYFIIRFYWKCDRCCWL